MNIYRVVAEDGSTVYQGRGSDPFTNKASAKRRATEMTNRSLKDHERYPEYCGVTQYKVQVSRVEWEDLNE